MNDSNFSANQDIAENEHRRLEALYRYDILDTMAESEFDGLTRLASRICDTPISLLNLLDLNRQWTKSSHGMDMTGREIVRENTICQYTIQGSDVLEIENLQTDRRFSQKWYVRDDPRIKFYAGAPLTTTDGYNIGSLCVMDQDQRQLSREQREDLKIVANEVISQLELRQREKKLQKINKQKDKLIRTVSHDLRNPLIGIIGTAEIIREDYSDEDLLRMAQIIGDSGDQMYSTISELLDSGILEIEEVQLNKSPGDPAKILQKVREIFQFLVKKKNIDLQMKIERKPARIMIDRHKFSRMIGNLLSNAVKFTPQEGTVTLVLDYEQMDEHNGRLMTQVRDTGMGIPESYIPHLFSGDNRQIRRSGTQNESSYGMGLEVVKKFVELHNGNIEVESEEDAGTTFTITLPVEVARE